MSTIDIITSNLAAAFLAGPWSIEAMARRAARACGRRERWMRRLARRVLAAFPVVPLPSAVDTLAAFICNDPGFTNAWSLHREQHDYLHQLFWVPDVMAFSAGVPSTWKIPALTSPGQVAEWLGLSPSELDWFADCQARMCDSVPDALRHYSYRWLWTRRNKVRLLEIPKARLKAIQRQLLHDVLDHLPPHDAAHGYRRGRSIASYVAPHAGRRIVLHFDLRDFFPSIPASRVHALFRTAGYPPAVARLLTGLCTNTVPREVLDARPSHEGQRGADTPGLRSSHLPQGAPTSPALANLCAYRLDCRLMGLACSVGANYTRYADDLVFSGGEELERCTRRFQVSVCRIALEERFEINTRKTHFMRQGVRQQVAGIGLNVHPNIRRDEIDRLKAILTNCVRHGPEGQNRDGRPDFRGYLLGRIAYVGMIHAARGQRLSDLFCRIVW